MVSVELGSFLVGVTGVVTAGVAIWRVLRTEKRHDRYVAAEGQDAKSRETVRQVREDLADYRTTSQEERERLENALAVSRRENDKLRSKLVELRALLAEKEIDLGTQMREVARLGAQVDQLLAGNDWPTFDRRPPRLEPEED